MIHFDEKIILTKKCFPQKGGDENAKNLSTCTIKLKIWSPPFSRPLKTMGPKKCPTTWWQCF